MVSRYLNKRYELGSLRNLHCPAITCFLASARVTTAPWLFDDAVDSSSPTRKSLSWGVGSNLQQVVKKILGREKNPRKTPLGTKAPIDAPIFYLLEEESHLNIYGPEGQRPELVLRLFQFGEGTLN